MKIETQHILVHIIYPVNIPKVRHLIISTPYYRFSEYLRCSSIPNITKSLYFSIPLCMNGSSLCTNGSILCCVPTLLMIKYDGE